MSDLNNTTLAERAMKIAKILGYKLDDWQQEVLTSDSNRVILNCCRQAGKSTVVALLALTTAVFGRGARIVIVSRSHRQAGLLFNNIVDIYQRMGQPMLVQRNAQYLALQNGSRVWSLPCREDTLRGHSGIDLLIIDEASRVPEDVYRALRPTLATTGGRIFLLSTPFGKRGFFHRSWVFEDWLKIQVKATQCPRISPEFLAEERKTLGEAWYRQEYMCSFEVVEGIVYPNIANCLTDFLPEAVKDFASGLRRVGGIDFGFRNPFAAIWGTVDKDNVLWLTGEYYMREKPLAANAANLPQGVFWYADPASPGEISSLRSADFKVVAAKNPIRPGIAAVQGRIENGGLRIYNRHLPCLMEEAGLYRYPAAGEQGDSETPLDQHNHALSALRYLIMGLDGKRLPFSKQVKLEKAEKKLTPEEAELERRKKAWKWWRNEALWTPLSGPGL